MTTKNRRAVGTLGLAAVIAVLTVSMIAMNITSQPLLAADEPAKAAKKAGMTMTNPVFAPLVELSGIGNPVPTVFSLGHFDIKSNDKGDWLVDSTIECATAVQTITKGKKDKDAPLEGGFAGAKVWFTLDGKPISISTGDRLDVINNTDFSQVPLEATWNLCEQVFEMKSNFNDLIIDCAEALTLNGTAFPSCEGDPNKLVFLCAVPEEEITECEQSLEVFTKVAGTHPAMVLIHDVKAGSSHVVEVWAALDAGATINSTLLFTNQTSASDNFVNAGVMIGKRIFVAEPIHMQTVTSEG